MASSQRLSLERSMNQFRRELTDDQVKEISSANRKTINYEIQKMQAKLGRERSLCRLNRIENFLNAMEHVEKLVTIFLNVSEAVAFIWGPIKLVIIAAKAWTDCVRKLLDVYEEIAEALDNLTLFHTLIKSDERFSRMLEDYFSDILRFHHSVLDFFSRPDWKAKFKWAWGDLRRKVKPTIESLKRKQAMLSDDKLQPYAILKEIQDADLYSKDQFKQINSVLKKITSSEDMRNQRIQEQEIKSSLERKLNVSLPQIASQLDLPDTVMGSSGSWILTDPIFQSWEASTTPQGGVLFLTGCPGAGKSTLARTIIHHMNQKQSRQPSSHSSVNYFFFKHDDPDRRSIRSMLCHIIAQIIDADGAMMRFAYDKCSSVENLDLAFLKVLALDCLSSKRDNFIVIDGLDEGMNNDPEITIEWCLHDLFRAVSSLGCRVRLLVCGQEDGRIEPLLSSYPKVRLHTADLHHKDIEDYCRTRASVIGDRFRLSSEHKNELILKVAEASNGMFLYTKVVLTNLASMGSKKEFRAELESDLFPRNLDEAYGRIIERIIASAEPSAQASAKKILGLVVSSERPLRWREIQSRFCIDADEASCDPDDLRVDTCKRLCSSLVDATDCEIFPGVQSEQTITIIHKTATKYLLHTNTIDLMQEHVNMSLFCCRYLSSGPFLAIDSGCMQDSVQSGYFSFMDYAAIYYQSHIQKVKSLINNMGSPLNLEEVKETLSNLRIFYYTDGLARTQEADSCEESSTSLDGAIQDRVVMIRSIIDKQRAFLSQNTTFQELEGPKRYKCPRLQCRKFFVGYQSDSSLRSHLASHERPFRCNYETCFAHTVGYASKQALQGHIKTFHGKSLSRITFPVGGKTAKMDFSDVCKAGDLRIVKSLHLADADLLNRSYKASPLKVALQAGHAHICKYLIDNGINPLVANRKGAPYATSAFQLAVFEGDLPMLELFLFGYQDLMNVSNMPRLASCVLDIFTNCPLAVDLLLRLRATRSSPGNSETIGSVMAKQLGTLFRSWGNRSSSLSAGQTVTHNLNDMTYLHKLFRQLFPKLYDQQGVLSLDPIRSEYEICQQAFKLHEHLLHNALLKRQYPLAAFLMDIDDKNLLQIPTVCGDMPMHSFIFQSCRSVCDCCAAIAQRLAKLDDGRFANVPNDIGKLPIHLAMDRASPDVLRTLLKCTFDLNHKDCMGNSPLHYVRTGKYLNILLQCKNIDLFIRNKKGQTVFAALCEDMYDLYCYKEDILQCLLKADKRLAWTADQSAERLTPLHCSMQAMDKSAAIFLLQLPEVEQILRAFSAAGVDGSRKLREFADMHKLEGALEAMDRTGFGLPHGH